MLAERGSVSASKEKLELTLEDEMEVMKTKSEFIAQ